MCSAVWWLSSLVFSFNSARTPVEVRACFMSGRADSITRHRKCSAMSHLLSIFQRFVAFHTYNTIEALLAVKPLHVTALTVSLTFLAHNALSYFIFCRGPIICAVTIIGAIVRVAARRAYASPKATSSTY